jgi:hypothetical protein
MNQLLAGNSFGFLGAAMTELSDSSADPHKIMEKLTLEIGSSGASLVLDFPDLQPHLNPINPKHT